MFLGSVLILHRMRKGGGEEEGIASQLFRLLKANGKKLWSTAMGVQLRHAQYTAHTQGKRAHHYISTHSIQKAVIFCHMS